MEETPVEDLVQVLVVAEVEARLGHRLTACQHDLVQPHDVLSRQNEDTIVQLSLTRPTNEDAQIRFITTQSWLWTNIESTKALGPNGRKTQEQRYKMHLQSDIGFQEDL